MIAAYPGRVVQRVTQQSYQLADHLEQIGRTERAGIYPPQELWRAFTAGTADAVLLNDLGRQAQARRRYQHAVWLYEAATRRGHNGAWRTLVWLRENSGDHAGAEVMAVQAADRGDTRVLWTLIRIREESGYGSDRRAGLWTALDRVTQTSLESLYQQAVDHGHIGALDQVAYMRERAGDEGGAEAARRQQLFEQLARRQLGGGPRLQRGPVDLEGDLNDDEDASFFSEQAPDICLIANQLARRGDLIRVRDPVAAEALYVQAVNCGDPYKHVGSLASMWVEADHRRALLFGLTGAGKPATSLSFDAGGGGH